MEAESSEPAAPRSTECDYGIVGAGTAGCVLAKRLSADPNINVLLIEAGGPDAPFWIDIPVGYPYAIGNPRTDWCFETTPQPGLNGRDDRLRLKGVAGVRVIDASVMPRITSGNTNAPTLMIAGKGVDFIRAEGAGRAAA